MPTTFLLVDDDERNLDLLEALLVPFQARCVRATNGRAALALAETETPDLVLLDLSMPGLDGIDVLLHLRSTPGLAELPVVLVTAHAEREQRLRAVKAGADDFLEKPVDAAMLQARVTTLLRLRRSRAELESAKAQLETQNEALRAAEQAKRELQEFIVHDLKGPLTALTVDVSWIRGAAKDEAVRTAAGDAVAAVTRLREMVEDLLATARLEATDELPAERLPVSLADLVEELARAHARVASERNIEIRTDLHPEAVTRGDAKLLRRLFENLMDNALRHTPRDGVVHWRLEAGEGAVVHVSNSGPPVPEDMRARLFDRYASGRHARAGHGNVGIGLYFCKRVAEAHGGSIELVSGAEQTTFCIRLPRA